MGGPPPRPLIDRFSTKYVIDSTGCWLWTAHRAKNGYGVMTVGKRPHAAPMGAHRISWTLHHGPIPDGMLVCHRCDVKHCVNPDHLFLGTAADNLRDMVEKGRSARGVKHSQAKLTDDEVRAIRRDPRILREVADDYGMSMSMISYIRTGQNWSHLQ